MKSESNPENLSRKQCTPCRGGVDPMTDPQITEYLKMLHEDWAVIEGKHLDRTFKFKNFKEALDFTNKVGQLAETQQHHPDIHLAWGKVKVQLWTHKIGGLHENDFILAAGIDRL